MNINKLLSTNFPLYHAALSSKELNTAVNINQVNIYWSIIFSVSHFAKLNSKNDKGNIICWCIQGTICKSLKRKAIIFLSNFDNEKVLKIIIIIIIIIINDVTAPFVSVFGRKVEKHIFFILYVNFFLSFRAKVVLFAEQDFRAWELLLMLNCFFKFSYKDNWNEPLILLCKEFENNTPFLSISNNHSALDGKTTIFKISGK